MLAAEATTPVPIGLTSLISSCCSAERLAASGWSNERNLIVIGADIVTSTPCTFLYLVSQAENCQDNFYFFGVATFDALHGAEMMWNHTDFEIRSLLQPNHKLPHPIHATLAFIGTGNATAKLIGGDVVSRQLFAYETICKTLVVLRSRLCPTDF